MTRHEEALRRLRAATEEVYATAPFKVGDLISVHGREYDRYVVIGASVDRAGMKYALRVDNGSGDELWNYRGDDLALIVADPGVVA